MNSIKELYKIGLGPSSSHTMGPSFAAERFRAAHPDAEKIRVTLFGSLAKTGKGHGTDRAVAETLKGVPTEIIFEGGKPEKNKLPKDGDWVDVVGIVSSNKNGLSCIKDAKVTILDIENKKEFAK